MQGSDGLSVGLKIAMNFPRASERSFDEDLGQTVGLERRISEYDLRRHCYTAGGVGGIRAVAR